MLSKSLQYSKHFNTSEFKCTHCGKIKISEKLIDNLETLFSKLHASKCIISSGYRCNTYDKQIGGFLGQHNKGLACDCIYYDEFNNPIPAKIVSCVAMDLELFNGIAPTNNPNYTHLDIRTTGYYHGDEQRGNDNYWTDPYTYFNVSKEEVSKYTHEVVESTNNDYRTLYDMNVRYGAGDNYGIKLVKELTIDGKKNALFTGENDYAIYKKGTIFTALEVIDNKYGKWAKTPSGYVCIKGSDGITYSEKI